eukprot:scaffold885_cov209-Skeletonema_marinoi.AAC.6
MSSVVVSVKIERMKCYVVVVLVVRCITAVLLCPLRCGQGVGVMKEVHNSNNFCKWKNKSERKDSLHDCTNHY